MKLTEGMRHCACCYGQYDRRYVDFEAAYDGPVLEGSIKVMIDDLVICEDCLKVAAKLIGLVNAEDLVKELDDERARGHADRMELGRIKHQNGKLREALELEPEPEEEPEQIEGQLELEPA